MIVIFVQQTFKFFIQLIKRYTVQHRSSFVDQQMLNTVATCWNVVLAEYSFSFCWSTNILARSWNGGRGNVAVALCFERCRRYYEASTKTDEEKTHNLDHLTPCWQNSKTWTFQATVISCVWMSRPSRTFSSCESEWSLGAKAGS